MNSLLLLFPLRYIDRPKGVFMDGHPVLEMPCKICDKLVDLTVDLCTDETGKAVHGDCYVQRIINQNAPAPATMIAD